MKSYKKLIARSIVGVMSFAVAAAGLAGFGSTTANAIDPQYTPAFNIYKDVQVVNDEPFDESKFVELRKSNGDPTASVVANPFIDPVNDKCAVGTMFDVRSYVHNGAHPDSNQNGSGPGVARNTMVSLTAPLGVAGKKFTFSSTISASNATSKSDTGTLNCTDNVKLELVPSKVYVYSKNYGWKQAPDAAVNGSLRIGSQTFGSGDVWGCWDERVMVVYTVKVVEVPTPPAPAYKCDLLTMTKIGDNKYRFQVNYTAINGATFKDVTYNFGDGQTVTDDTEVDHQYAASNNNKTVTAVVNFVVNGQVVSDGGPECTKSVPLNPEKCPVPGKEHLPKNDPGCYENCPIPGKTQFPKDSPECKETPKVLTAVKELPKTGAGGLAGLFTVVTAAGAGAHNLITRRKNRI